MCEHKWTIVYIDAEPIGVSCEHCEEARPIGKADDEPPTLAVLPGGIYRIPTGYGPESWELLDWQLQNEQNRPSYLRLEFRQAIPDLPF